MSAQAEKGKSTAVRIAEDWGTLIRELNAETRHAANQKGNGKSLTAYEKPDGTLQRLTYAFTSQYNKYSTRSLLKEFLDTRLDIADENADKPKYSGRSHHNSYEFYDNPYDYALKAILAETTISISDSTRSRTGWALLYAERHEIDPDLLVGFIYQSGTLDSVAQKAKLERTREAWYYNNMKVQPDAPLVVIDFDGIEQSLDGFPVRMARARFTEKAGKISSGSTLIKPAKSWKVDEDWYAGRGQRLESIERSY